MKAIVHAGIVLEDGILEDAAVVFDDRIRQILPDGAPDSCEIIDAGGKYLLPGLIDMHIHGYCGRETTEASVDAQRAMAAALLKDGVTGFLPTLGTAPLETIAGALEATRACMRESGGAKVHGAYVEGVFISEKKKGAHNAELLLAPDYGFLERYKDVIKVVIVAPERYPDLIDWCVERNIVSSIGHTDATYEQAMQGVRHGATQATHLFNAMRGIGHREPGAAGAALLSDGVRVELIADTVHVDRALFKLVYKVKGADGIVLITDSSIAAGLGPGIYRSNERTIYVDGTVGRLENGTISGSVSPLRRNVYNFHRYGGAPLWEAVRMASLNPARALKIDGRVGSLRPGKCADMFLCDAQLNVECTFLDGECVYRRA